MVGRSYSLDMRRVETNTDLRISLYEMKEDVQRLQQELDAERDASASSASEAMSVILRLQGEKAMLAMEASQYKRMAEERMSHAQLSMELLEDLNYRREVQIKNLECRLNAYRGKLMSLDAHSPDDRSQTPSPEPVITDLCVPVEKGVIEQSVDSTRHQEKILVSYCDQVKKLDFRDSVHETKNGEKGEAFAASSSKIQDIVATKKAKKSSKQKRDRTVKRDHARGSSFATDVEYQAELERLKERVERLERERCNSESQTHGVKEENMNLQRKSEEEISFVQSERKSSRTTSKLLPSVDSAIVGVQEAMLYFWL